MPSASTPRSQVAKGKTCLHSATPFLPQHNSPWPRFQGKLCSRGIVPVGVPMATILAASTLWVQEVGISPNHPPQASFQAHLLPRNGGPPSEPQSLRPRSRLGEEAPRSRASPHWSARADAEVAPPPSDTAGRGIGEVGGRHRQPPHPQPCDLQFLPNKAV